MMGSPHTSRSCQDYLHYSNYNTSCRTPVLGPQHQYRYVDAGRERETGSMLACSHVMRSGEQCGAHSAFSTIIGWQLEYTTTPVRSSFSCRCRGAVYGVSHGARRSRDTTSGPHRESGLTRRAVRWYHSNERTQSMAGTPTAPFQLWGLLGVYPRV